MVSWNWNTIAVALVGLCAACNAFSTHHVNGQNSFKALHALTERQMQFWEDVDAGLDDIENFYVKKDQDIDRIRKFAKT